MKKVFVSFLTLLFCASAFALPTRGFIFLAKPLPPVSPRPGSLPLASELPLFSAFQDVDELIITSEAVSAVVTVNIYNSVGAVVETVTASVAVGGEISVDITSLPEGAYILEIAFDDIVYVGQFEL